MASPVLGVLLRNCQHDNNDTSTSKVRFVLQCDNFAVQIARTPIQMPIPGNSPELMDFGIFRPSLSISGMVPTVGGESEVNAAGLSGQSNIDYFAFLEHTNYARKRNNDTVHTQKYFLPTKNVLEKAAYTWQVGLSSIEVEIADASVPSYNKYSEGSTIPNNHTTAPNLYNTAPTGGGVYRVAIQQARFQVDASKEDRWSFQMQFVSEARDDLGL